MKRWQRCKQCLLSLHESKTYHNNNSAIKWLTPYTTTLTPSSSALKIWIQQKFFLESTREETADQKISVTLALCLINKLIYYKPFMLCQPAQWPQGKPLIAYQIKILSDWLFNWNYSFNHFRRPDTGFKMHHTLAQFKTSLNLQTANLPTISHVHQ